MTANAVRLVAVDGRLRTAKRFKQIVGELLAACRDADFIDMTLIRGAAGLILHFEALQERIANGQAVDTDQLVRIAGACRRLLSGVRRMSKPAAAPAIFEYLRRKRGRTR